MRNVHLITLAYLKEASPVDGDVRMPFTKDFIVACKQSKKAHELTERWLLCKGG
ncbi:MAG: hypothetical protein WCN87_00725 [Chlamydiota bacterium]